MSARLSTKARSAAIARILESNFHLAAFEKLRRAETSYWATRRNDMAHGTYGQALRERERLRGASDSQICAELSALPEAA